MTSVAVCHRRYRQISGGFTLIEVLVAITIFVVMAAMAYGGLRVVLDARDSYERNNDRLADVQTFFLIMQRDIEQTVDRPIRDGFGDRQPSLTGDRNGLELTHAGLRNPAGFARSHLQRVAYVLEADTLVRLVWPVIDRAQDSEPVRSYVLEGVETVELRFLDAKHNWQTKWPADKLGDEQPAALPRAVEVSIDYRDWGRLTRLFALPLSINNDKNNVQT